MQLTDGTGTNYAVKVDSNNKLRTYSITEPEPVWANEDFGLSYTMLAFVTPDTQNPSESSLDTTCFAYLKNSDDKDLIIDEIRAWVGSSAEAFDIYINHSGTPVGGTDVSPINMNLGSGKTATGTFLTGTDITGLSGGTLFDRLRIPYDNDDHVASWPSKLYIPKNKILSFHANDGGQEIEFSISFHYHP